MILVEHSGDRSEIRYPNLPTRRITLPPDSAQPDTGRLSVVLLSPYQNAEN
jgi:hypothetical protein